MRRILFALGLAALIIAIALAVTDPSHAAPRKPRPCIGVVVRVIDPGIEIVKRADKTICQRPAITPIKKPVRVKR